MEFFLFRYLMESKIYGTTLYLGVKKLKTKYGDFNALVYQDVITTKYIIALINENTFNNLYDNEAILYTRIHSSCITSEMFNSQDCDCVEQLNGAIKIIGELGGILFYLIQEGRGCGYIGKARGCQMVQYDEYYGGNMNTFDAYKNLGMKKDYRKYHNIKEILVMLKLENKSFNLLTNNPDKINGLKNLDINIINTTKIEFVPNLFNRSYLISKQNSGHMLDKIKKELNVNFLGLDPTNKENNLQNFLPFKPIKVFEPYKLDNYKRFILFAKYYIPIRPINNRFVLSKEQIEFIERKKVCFEMFNTFIYVNKLKDIENLNIINPYWFRVNLYYDITTNLDYVLLYYENPFIDTSSITPLVRIQSESIFDRFPLDEKRYKNRYNHSIQKIIENGKGYLLLFYRDGRGSGLGYYLLDNKDISGVKEDMRDYDAACQILKSNLNDNKFDILYTNYSKFNLKLKLKSYKLNFRNWISIKDDNNLLISERIFNLENDYNYYINSFSKKLKLYSNKKYIVTGIGSSSYHSKFLYNLLKDNYNIIYEEFAKIIDNNYSGYNLILVTQGLSPNSKIILDKFNIEETILFSSKTIDGIGQNILLVEDKNDDTLVRISGPVINFGIIYKSINEIKENINFDDIYKLSKKNNISNLNYNKVKSSQIIWICNSSIIDYMGEISNKFMEVFYCFSGKVISYLEFSHGTYQSSLYHDNIIYILLPDELQELAENMLKKEMIEHIYKIESLGVSNKDFIKYEIYFSYVIDLILNNSDIDIDFTKWKGINTQKLLYNIKKN